MRSLIALLLIAPTLHAGWFGADEELKNQIHQTQAQLAQQTQKAEHWQNTS